MKNFMTVLLAAFFAFPAAADHLADLNQPKVTVDNEPGESLVIRRSALTPLKVKIKMNPEVRYRQRCFETRQPKCRELDPYTDYETFTLRFKNNRMEPGQVDAFRVVPITRTRARLEVIETAREYSIESDRDQDEFEFTQY